MTALQKQRVLGHSWGPRHVSPEAQFYLLRPPVLTPPKGPMSFGFFIVREYKGEIENRILLRRPIGWRAKICSATTRGSWVRLVFGLGQRCRNPHLED
jgi:hypothetical protein